MVTYERTRRCGCGDCSFKPMSEGSCPQINSKDAVWLWVGKTVADPEPEEVDLADEIEQLGEGLEVEVEVEDGVEGEIEVAEEFEV